MDKEDIILFFEKMYDDDNASGLDIAFGNMFNFLVNSDGFINEDDFKKAIDNMKKVKDALKDANVSEEFKAEYLLKIEHGVHILERDLDLFKR